MILKNIKTIAKKSIKLNLRFKYNYFFSTLITPVKLFIMFLVIYTGFFSAGAVNVGSVSSGNYLNFLLLGSLVYALFSSAYSLFNTKFIDEKFWNTIQALLVAPVRKISLIIGEGLSELLVLSLVMGPLFFIAFLIKPIFLFQFAIVILIVLMIYFGTIGFSLILGAFALVNEDLLFLSNYIMWGWAFLSCFFYPIQALPEFLHPLVNINPVYHGLFIIRNIWANGFVENFFFHFSFVLIFAITVPLVSGFLFKQILKRRDISGY